MFLIDTCFSGKFENVKCDSLAKSGHIFLEFPKVIEEKKKKKIRQLTVIQRSMRRTEQVFSEMASWPAMDKGMICEWCIENKQTLVAQNVLNSTRFIDGCTSYKAESIS